MQKNHFISDAEFKNFMSMTGIDEAGRGCLAGPVVVASVTWRPQEVCTQSWFSSMGDSKQLSAAVRAELYQCILHASARVRVAVISNILVDYLNILRATLHGFELVAPEFNDEIPLCIDGNQRPPSLSWARTVVKGDRKLSAVAAAGIVAKVTRDGLMDQLAGQLPCYGLGVHKGYATKAHRLALEQHGASAWHRKSFSPIRQTLGEEMPADSPLRERVAEASVWQLNEIWHHFRTQYHTYSCAGARRIMDTFQTKGFALIPCVNEVGPD